MRRFHDVEVVEGRKPGVIRVNVGHNGEIPGIREFRRYRLGVRSGSIDAVNHNERRPWTRGKGFHREGVDGAGAGRGASIDLVLRQTPVSPAVYAKLCIHNYGLCGVAGSNQGSATRSTALSP